MKKIEIPKHSSWGNLGVEFEVYFGILALYFGIS